MKNLKEVKELRSLEGAVKALRETRREIKELEETKKSLEEIVAPAVEKAGGSLEIAGYEITLTWVTRDNFKLRDAINSLGRKLLEPWITTSEYRTLRFK